jgi:replicative DNA helicase
VVAQDGELPHDIESESAVLGSLFIDETYIHRVAMMLESSDFYSPNHRGVYNSMLSLTEKGVPIGVLQLIEEGADQGTVLALEDVTCTATACMHFAQKVKDIAYQREVYRYGYNLIQISKKSDAPSIMEDITEAVGLGYENILNKSTGKGDDVYSSDGITGLCDTIKDKRGKPGIHGIRTQFPLFDRVVKGLKTINLITATTGFGKTALALQWAYNIGVKQNIPSLYINYEMEADELTERLLACGSGVWLDKIQTGDIPKEDCQKVDDTAKLLGGSKLNITGCQSKTD